MTRRIPDGSEWSHKLHNFFIDLGVQAERSGDPEAALGMYEKAVKSQPESALAWYNLGDALLALKRHDEAIPALSKALELSPGNALYLYDLGLALYESGCPKDAAKAFATIVDQDTALKRASSHLVLSAMTNLALSKEKAGDVDGALETLAPARRTAFETLYNLGRFAFLAKKPAEAWPLAQAAAAVAPDAEDAVHLAGRVLMDLKREAEALEFLRRATKLNPRCVDAWYDLGVTLARLKQRKEARTCFRQALKRDPDYAWAYYDLACLDALEGKPDAAFRSLEQAVAHGFNNVEHLRRDADLKSLRRDARWKKLVERLG